VIFLRQTFFIYLLIRIFLRKLHHHTSRRSDDLPSQKNVLQSERLDLLPMPDGVEDARDLQIDNRGCKWGDRYTRIKECWDGYLELDFESPWGPPSEVVVEIARRYPGLCFDLYYEELGVDLDGRLINENNL